MTGINASNEAYAAVANHVETVAPVNVAPATEAWTRRTKWKRASQDRARSARERVAYLIAAKSQPALVTVAKVAELTGLSVEEAEAALSELQEDGLIAHRNRSQELPGIHGIRGAWDLVTPSWLDSATLRGKG